MLSQKLCRLVQTAKLYESQAILAMTTPGLPMRAYKKARRKLEWAKALRKEAETLYSEALSSQLKRARQRTYQRKEGG